jgi:Ca2+-binding RTX toxin-like protein
VTSILRTTLRVGLAGVAAAASIGALAVPAHAAGVTSAAKSGNTLLVTAAAGTINDVNLSRSVNGQFYNITDAAGFAPGAGCQTTGPRSVMCSAIGISEIRISAGDGNDRVRLSTSTFSRVLGGTGNDRLTSSHIASSARLSGNEGDDVIIGSDFDSLFGQDGNDVLSNGRLLSGGNGNDTMFGGRGNDTMNGNAGIDHLDGGEGFDDLCAEAESTVNCEAF